MISLVTDGKSMELASLCQAEDVCACRIACLFDSYASYRGIADFWVCCDEDGHPAAAAAKYGSDMTVFINDNSCLEEITGFIKAVGCSSVLSNIPLFDGKEFVVMRYVPQGYHVSGKDERYIISFEPYLRNVWQMMKKCRSESFAVPEYEDFLLDASHRLRHGTARCCAVCEKEEIVSFAMTTALSETTAVIGAVCTAPEYRGKGLGSVCMGQLLSQLTDKAVFITREKNRNEHFYHALGFENVGKCWIH